MCIIYIYLLIYTNKACKSGWGSWLLFQRSPKRRGWLNLGTTSQKIYKKTGQRQEMCIDKTSKQSPHKTIHRLICPVLLTDLNDPCAETWKNYNNSIQLNNMKCLVGQDGSPYSNHRISPRTNASNFNQHLPQTKLPRKAMIYATL